MPTDTVRLTVAQAIVTYLSKQHSVAELEAVARLRAEYKDGLVTQRWRG